MGADDPTFRRRRDEEWCAKVDHEQTTLMLGYQSILQELSQARTLITELDAVLRGDPTEDREGISEQLHQIQKDLALLKAVVFKDATGRGGLLDDVRAIKEGREDRRIWNGSLTKIIVAAITSGFLAHFWGEIRAYINKKTNDPLDEMIDAAKHPKPVHRHYTIKKEPDDDETTR